MHGFITLSDATSYDKTCLNIYETLFCSGQYLSAASLSSRSCLEANDHNNLGAIIYSLIITRVFLKGV